MSSAEAIHRDSPIQATAGATAFPRALGIALIVLGLFRLWTLIPGAEARNDFAHYYLSAQILALGGDPYQTPLAPLCRELGFEYDARIPYGANPPLLIRTMTLIAWLSPEVAYRVWLGVQAASLIALLFVTRRVLNITSDDRWWWLGVGLVLNSTALMRHVHYSQVQLLVAAVLASALWAHLRGRSAMAMGLVTAAAAFKIYPAVLAPWFLLADLKNFRDFAKRSFVGVGVGLAALAATGPDAWHGFVVEGLPVIQKSVGGSLTNYSLASGIALLSESFVGALSGNAAKAALVAGKLAGALAIIGALGMVWRFRIRGATAFSLLTIAMLAASPVCWSHYFVLMVLPVFLLTQESQRSPDTQWGALALIAGWGCLMPEMDAIVFLGNATPIRIALHLYPLGALGVAAWALVKNPNQQKMGPSYSS